jgi:hypothetical protein
LLGISSTSPVAILPMSMATPWDETKALQRGAGGVQRLGALGNFVASKGVGR